MVRSTLQAHQTLLTALTHVPSPRVKSPPCKRHGTLTMTGLEPATLQLMPHTVLISRCCSDRAHQAVQALLLQQ